MDGPGKVNPTPTPQQAPSNPVPPLTPIQRQDWNSFIDFTEKEGYKGNPILDDKDKKLGMYLMQKYKSLNPKSTITYADVPRVQSELQQVKTNAIQEYRKNPSEFNGVKSEDEILPSISKVDGWLGSKTSSNKFPVATLIKNTPGKSDTTYYGTNIAALK